uniref:Uncharacterized protein n=1 Tax=Gouania willdenowi TaxID=441366 RepID=A0A8C5EHJ2_GOUWI
MTLQKKPKSGLATCVFWEDKRTNITENEKPGDIIHWSEEGCWLSYSDENLTVCSCSHLSTFALIMQIGEVYQAFLACTVMAGILHFLVVASFMWMLLEAVQLYLLVQRLTKVQVIQKDGLPWPLLYLIGYGIPFVIIGVSALVYSDGYGPTEAGACWLSQKRSFNWALTGPVIAVLVVSAFPPSISMVIIFKIVAQFVILGCTWILGLYQTNIFFQVLFIVLNSQQEQLFTCTGFTITAETSSLLQNSFHTTQGCRSKIHFPPHICRRRSGLSPRNQHVSASYRSNASLVRPSSPGGMGWCFW